MGNKRQFEEVDSQDPESGASEKRQKSYFGRKRKPQDDSGARKRARAIERTLRRKQDLPANVRIDLERELAVQKQIADDKAHKKKRSTMISRYHMVRFFERKKASRLAKQLKRKLDAESDPAEAEKIRHDLHIAEVDEAYTLYFPHLETYVGLYGNSAKSNAEEQTAEAREAAAKAALQAGRPPMWPVIEKAMEEGQAALESLRDRRSPTDTGEVGDTRPPIRPLPPAPTSTPALRPAPAKKQDRHLPGKKSGSFNSNSNDNSKGSSKDKQPELNRRERRRLMREGMIADNSKDDDDEEGGFFEDV